MPAPRAPGAVFLSKNQTRQMENRNNAQQEARYTPQAYINPYTVDAADASALKTWAPASPPTWQYTKVKGLTSAFTFTRISFGDIAVAGVGTPECTVAICEYAADGQFLVMREIARGRSGRRNVDMPGPVTLTPDKLYAVAVVIQPAVATTVDVPCSQPGMVITKVASSDEDASFIWDVSQGSNTTVGSDSSGSPIQSIFSNRNGTSPQIFLPLWY